MEKTLVEPNISSITIKLQNALDISWLTLVEISRRFSEKYPEDWKEILSFYKENPTYCIDESLAYIEKKIEYLCRTKYADSHGQVGPFRLFKMGEKCFKDMVTVDTNIPRPLHKKYTRMARRLGCTLDEMFNVGLRFYMTQKMYQSLTPPDFLKLLIVDAFGMRPFHSKDLWSIARYKDFSTMYDPSLAPYVREEGKPDMDKFLIKLPDGRFQIGVGYGS